MNTLNDEVAIRIVMLRKSLGLSQVEFGSRIGLTQAAMSLTELGQRRISLRDAVNIADEFSLSVDGLCGRDQYHEPVDHILARDILARIHMLTAEFARAVS